MSGEKTGTLEIPPELYLLPVNNKTKGIQMSGAKTGSVAVAPALFLLPIIGAAALVGGAAAGLTMAGRGIFRFGKATYDTIDHTIENAVAKEHEKKMAFLNRVLAENDPQKAITEETPNIFRDISAEKVLENENYNALIEKIKSMADAREKIEEKKGLRNHVSQKFMEEIKQFNQQQKKSQQRFTMEETKIKQTDYGKNYASAYQKIEALKSVFPIFAQEIYATLENFEPSKGNFLSLERQLNERLVLLKDWKKEHYVELKDQYLMMHTHPLYCQLEEKEQQEFLNRYEANLNHITNSCHDSNEAKKVIEEFALEIKQLLGKGRKRDMESRFKLNLDLLNQAMENKSYMQVGKVEKDETIHLTFQTRTSKTEPGKKVRFSLKKADVGNSDIDDFTMEVDTIGFETEEQRNIEGKAVMNELESLGIQVEYYDLTAPLSKEKNAEAIKKIIKKELAKKNIHNVSIQFETNASVRVGEQIYDADTHSVKNVVANYLAKAGIQPMRNSDREKVRENIQ